MAAQSVLFGGQEAIEHAVAGHGPAAFLGSPAVWAGLVAQVATALVLVLVVRAAATVGARLPDVVGDQGVVPGLPVERSVPRPAGRCRCAPAWWRPSPPGARRRSAPPEPDTPHDTRGERELTLPSLPISCAFPSLAPAGARSAVAAVLVVVGLTACGGDGDTAPPPPRRRPHQSTTTPTSTAATSTTTGPERTTVVVGYAGGTVDSPDEVDVKLGDDVVIRATSDVAEEIHVHTYDKRLDLAPGVPGELTFKADIPGVHEVELEKAHKQLFRLRVQ